jgi:hypothetical protein
MSVEATNIEPPMEPSNSALKTGLGAMLWCYVIVISTCYAIVLLGGAMSVVRYVFFGICNQRTKKPSSQFSANRKIGGAQTKKYNTSLAPKK